MIKYFSVKAKYVNVKKNALLTVFLYFLRRFIRTDRFYGSASIKMLLTKNMCVPENANFHVINLKIPQEFIRDRFHYEGYTVCMCVCYDMSFLGPQQFCRISTLEECITCRRALLLTSNHIRY